MRQNVNGDPKVDFTTFQGVYLHRSHAGQWEEAPTPTEGQKSRIRFVFVKCSLLEVVVVEFKFHLKGIIVDSVDAGQ